MSFEDEESGHPVEVHTVSVSVSADYCLVAPAHEAAEKPFLLLALHGWGETCRRFIQPFVPLRKNNLVIVAPQAPHPFYVKLETKRVGFTWLTKYERDRAVDETNRYLETVIAQVDGQHRIDSRGVILLGFSQGVSVAWRFALSGLRPVVGLIACGGDLPPDVREKLAERGRFPVLAAHGSEDRIVPKTAREKAVEVLEKEHFSVEVLDYAGGHRITPELVEEIGVWIERVVSGSTAG